MSINTLLGVIFGMMMVVGSIFLATSNFLVFWDSASIVLVLGGTIASTFISYEARYVLLAIRDGLFRTLMVQRVGRNILNFEVGRIIRWGYVVQAKGPLALEQEVRKIKSEDAFVGFGVELLITGYTGKEVREIMMNAVESTFDRSVVQSDILKYMASTAPAFGMIGTVIGLVVMLEQLGGDPTKMGPAMAVALLTTLYGVLLARLVFLPGATKIRQREEIRRFRNYLIAEGLGLLADRKNPRMIQDTMNSFLDPAIHFDIDQQLRSRQAGAAAGGGAARARG